MAAQRYNLIPESQWKMTSSPLWRAIDLDFTSLESDVAALKSGGVNTGGTGTVTSVAWADVTGKPAFATVATSGSYNDLTSKPDLTVYAPKASPTFTGTVTFTGTTVVGLTKSSVGLGNVDNTADANKVFAASQITSGVFARARLGTGTADGTTILYGDGTWKTAPSGGSVPEGTTVTVKQNSDGTWPTVPGGTRLAGVVYQWRFDYDATKWPTVDATHAQPGDGALGADSTVVA